MIEAHILRGLVSGGILVDAISKLSWETEESERTQPASFGVPYRWRESVSVITKELKVGSFRLSFDLLVCSLERAYFVVVGTPATL